MKLRYFKFWNILIMEDVIIIFYLSTGHFIIV